MPTGYTSDIKDGITFKQYALGCARAFGALFHMRDKPCDVEIPDEVPVSDYHTEELKKYKEELSFLEKCNYADFVRLCNEQNEKKQLEYEQRAEDNRLLKQKYVDMLSKVEAWEPPSEDHVELKKFMIDQLESSIKVDVYKENPPVMVDVDEYITRRKNGLVKEIKYHTEKLQEEIESAKERSVWIKKLKKSLDNDPQ